VLSIAYEKIWAIFQKIADRLRTKVRSIMLFFGSLSFIFNFALDPAAPSCRQCPDSLGFLAFRERLGSTDVRCRRKRTAAAGFVMSVDPEHYFGKMLAERFHAD